MLILDVAFHLQHIMPVLDHCWRPIHRIHYLRICNRVPFFRHILKRLPPLTVIWVLKRNTIIRLQLVYGLPSNEKNFVMGNAHCLSGWKWMVDFSLHLLRRMTSLLLYRLTVMLSVPLNNSLFLSLSITFSCFSLPSLLMY